MEQVSLRLGYLIHPPQKEVFVPSQKGLAPPQITRISQATATLFVSQLATPSGAAKTEVFLATPTSTPAATPLPGKAALSGVVYSDQHGSRRNYCAPANLTMALSFWGWQGTRDELGRIIKPDDNDKNVMPYEMVDFIEDHTNLQAVLRVGGDKDTLRRFIAAGYPVLIEKGVYFNDLTGVVSWMGHYQVVTGYDDAGGFFITQDSFLTPDYQVSYEEMVQGWRAFNYPYIIVFPPDHEAMVFNLLGVDADETANYQNAAHKASNEIYGLSGIDQYFAWFNRGSSLVDLQDYGGAAAAFDEAFKIYPSIPENKRPWRMLWYQTGPYFAYYGVQRYYDLLYLADGTLQAMQGDKNLEESYYWRGMARSALGDAAAAIEDFQLSLKYHPGFEPAIYQLKMSGIENP